MNSFEQVLQATEQRIMLNAEQAVRRAGLKMEEVAKELAVKNGSMATGHLVSSIKSEVTVAWPFITLQFGSYAKSGDGYFYPSVIEYGRRPGQKPPPVAAIFDWLMDKGKNGQFKLSYEMAGKGKQQINYRTKSEAKMDFQNSILTHFAFIIAKKIGKNGTKPKPFLRPAFEVGVEKLKEELPRGK